MWNIASSGLSFRVRVESTTCGEACDRRETDLPDCSRSEGAGCHRQSSKFMPCYLFVGTLYFVTSSECTVDQNRRWDSDFSTVKDLFAKGVFGEISEFEVCVSCMGTSVA